MRPGRIAGPLPKIGSSSHASVVHSVGRKTQSRSHNLRRIRPDDAAGQRVLLRTHQVEFGQRRIDVPGRFNVTDKVGRSGNIGRRDQVDQGSPPHGRRTAVPSASADGPVLDRPSRHLIARGQRGHLGHLNALPVVTETSTDPDAGTWTAHAVRLSRLSTQEERSGSLSLPFSLDLA